MKKNRYILMTGLHKVGEASSIQGLAEMVGCTRMHIIKQIGKTPNQFSYKKKIFNFDDKLTQKGLVFERDYFDSIKHLPADEQLIIINAILAAGFENTKPTFTKNHLQVLWDKITTTPIRTINENN